MTEQLKNKIFSIIGVILYILFVYLVWHYISVLLVDKEVIRHFVSNFGVFGFLAFTLIQITQNIIAPIAHYPILIAGGYIFHPWLGFLLNWVGTSIGTFLIILLTRKFGRPLVCRMVKKEFIEKYDTAVKKLSSYGLFLIYALPVFPDDEITYLVGLSAMPKRQIFWAIVLGKIPGAALSFLGYESLQGAKIVLYVQILVVLIGSIGYFLFRKFRKPAKDLKAINEIIAP